MRTPVRAAVGTALFPAVRFLLVGTAFYAGYVTARVGAPVPLVGSLPLPPGVAAARSRVASSDELRARLGVVDEAWRIVNDEYYAPARPAAHRRTSAATRAIVGVPAAPPPSFPA